MRHMPLSFHGGTGGSVKKAMNKLLKWVIGVVLCMLGVAGLGAAEALPTAYAAIGTDATATFGWAKEFAIGVIIFTFVVSLVGLAKKRR
jgi:hypothetical protein